jgi:EAL domain-containing protein (putative c-di-GMP-specific phosphodiesterase class I)
MPGTALEKVLHVAWKLIEALRMPFEIEGLSLQVDTSLGITLFPDHGHDAESLIQRADVAMYVAKRKRSSLAVYRPEQDFNHMRHLTLRGDLRKAIDNGRLSLSYQPKVLAESDQVVGAEALLRWRHPKHGNIPPDEFIGLAEHSGLIRSLTHWVLKTALQQIAQWRQEGFELGISINLSARNLMEEDLPITLRHLLNDYQVSAEQLTLEITESVIMEDPERALRIVTRLRELGVGISVDDFGTGYSSLGYLMRLPARELKIDKSFVMQMETDPGSATIVHSTIDLAHNLGLKVVAEGVESESIWRVLKELGCDMGQGYHFSRPLPAEKLLPAVFKLNGQAGGTPASVSALEPLVTVTVPASK